MLSPHRQYQRPAEGWANCTTNRYQSFSFAVSQVDADGYANDDRPDDGEENDNIFHKKAFC
jgi:hypothetical protein